MINDCFHKNYPMDAYVELLPTRSVLVSKGEEGAAKIDDRDSDCVLKIGNDYYLMEVQAYDDEHMAIRIAEYTFIAARDRALGSQEHVTLNIPHFTVIYIKPSDKTPRYTNITYAFPDGQQVTWKEKNVFLSDLSKEEIIEKKLYAFIPFYAARYEYELTTENNYQKVLEDLAYFRDKMIELHREKKLTGDEFTDLGSFVNTIVLHITDGNGAGKEAVKIMGGTAFETESERIRREAHEEDAAIIAEKDRALAEKDEALAEKDEALAQHEKELEASNKRIAELEALLARGEGQTT